MGEMERSHSKKILLMGGSRFIGIHLLRALHKKGHEVTVFNRALTRRSAPYPKGINFVRGDRDNPEDIKKLFNAQYYDVLIDIHGWKPEHVIPILQNYRLSIGHYIYLSTTGVYKDPVEYPITEESPRRYIDGGKAQVEDLLFKAYKENQFSVTIFRPHGVIGPYDPCSMGLIFYRLMHALPLFVHSKANTRINYLDVHDLVKAFMLAMNNSATFGSAYVLAGDDMMTPAEFIGLCGKICSKTPKLKFIDDIAIYENAKYVKERRFVDFCVPWPKVDQVIDNRKIKKDLGLEFTNIETTIRETYSWLLAKPSRLKYFTLSGEQYILTGRPIPYLMKAHWKLMDILEDAVKGVRETMKNVQMIKKSYFYLKRLLLVQIR